MANKSQKQLIDQTISFLSSLKDQINPETQNHFVLPEEVRLINQPALMLPSDQNPGVDNDKKTSLFYDFHTTKYWDNKKKCLDCDSFDRLDRLVNSLPTGDASKPFFDCLVHNLKSFAGFYFDWHINWLNASLRTPPNADFDGTAPFALYAFFNQIGHEVAAITLAITQRLIPSNCSISLDKLDELAQKLIDDAVKAGYFNDSAAPPNTLGPKFPGPPLPPKDVIDAKVKRNAMPKKDGRPYVLTYIGKSPAIRVMPYSQIVLVGLPMEALCAEPDRHGNFSGEVQTTLAHEIGLLVFRKGFCDSFGAKFVTALNRKMLGQSFSPWICDIVEPVFAEIFTVQQVKDIAACVQFIMRRAHAKQLERTFHDEMRYQISPELRPEIYFHILGLMYPGNPLISTLKIGWQNLSRLVYGRIVQSTGPITLARQNQLVTRQWNGNAYVGLPAAIDELLKLVNLMYRSYMTPTAPFPSTGPASPTRIYDPATVTRLKSYWNQDTWNEWANRLLIEEEIISEWTKQNVNYELGEYATFWHTLLYSNGWIMQSNGSSSGPY